MKRHPFILSPLPVAFLCLSLASPPVWALRTESVQQAGGLEELAGQLAAPFKPVVDAAGLEEGVYSQQERKEQVADSLRGIPAPGLVSFSYEGTARGNDLIFRIAAAMDPGRPYSQIPLVPGSYEGGHFKHALMPLIPPLEGVSGVAAKEFSFGELHAAVNKKNPPMVSLIQSFNPESLPLEDDPAAILAWKKRILPRMRAVLDVKGSRKEELAQALETLKQQHAESAPDLNQAVAAVEEVIRAEMQAAERSGQAWNVLDEAARGHGKGEKPTVTLQEYKDATVALQETLSFWPRVFDTLRMWFDAADDWTESMPLEEVSSDLGLLQEGMLQERRLALSLRAKPEAVTAVYYWALGLALHGLLEQFERRVESEPDTISPEALRFLYLQIYYLAMEQTITLFWLTGEPALSAEHVSPLFADRFFVLEPAAAGAGGGAATRLSAEGSSPWRVRREVHGGGMIAGTSIRSAFFSPPAIRSALRAGEAVALGYLTYTGTPDVEQVERFFEEWTRLQKILPTGTVVGMALVDPNGGVRVYFPKFQPGDEKGWALAYGNRQDLIAAVRASLGPINETLIANFDSGIAGLETNPGEVLSFDEQREQAADRHEAVQRLKNILKEYEKRLGYPLGLFARVSAPVVQNLGGELRNIRWTNAREFAFLVDSILLRISKILAEQSAADNEVLTQDFDPVAVVGLPPGRTSAFSAVSRPDSSVEKREAGTGASTTASPAEIRFPIPAPDGVNPQTWSQRQAELDKKMGFLVAKAIPDLQKDPSLQGLAVDPLVESFAKKWVVDGTFLKQSAGQQKPFPVLEQLQKGTWAPLEPKRFVAAFQAWLDEQRAKTILGPIQKAAREGSASPQSVLEALEQSEKGRLQYGVLDLSVYRTAGQDLLAKTAGAALTQVEQDLERAVNSFYEGDVLPAERLEQIEQAFGNWTALLAGIPAVFQEGLGLPAQADVLRERIGLYREVINFVADSQQFESQEQTDLVKIGLSSYVRLLSTASDLLTRLWSESAWHEPLFQRAVKVRAHFHDQVGDRLLGPLQDTDPAELPEALKRTEKFFSVMLDAERKSAALFVHEPGEEDFGEILVGLQNRLKAFDAMKQSDLLKQGMVLEPGDRIVLKQYDGEGQEIPSRAIFVRYQRFESNGAGPSAKLEVEYPSTLAVIAGSETVPAFSDASRRVALASFLRALEAQSKNGETHLRKEITLASPASLSGVPGIYKAQAAINPLKGFLTKTAKNDYPKLWFDFTQTRRLGDQIGWNAAKSIFETAWLRLIAAELDPKTGFLTLRVKGSSDLEEFLPEIAVANVLSLENKANRSGEPAPTAGLEEVALSADLTKKLQLLEQEGLSVRLVWPKDWPDVALIEVTGEPFAVQRFLEKSGLTPAEINQHNPGVAVQVQDEEWAAYLYATTAGLEEENSERALPDEMKEAIPLKPGETLVLKEIFHEGPEGNEIRITYSGRERNERVGLTVSFPKFRMIVNGLILQGKSFAGEDWVDYLGQEWRKQERAAKGIFGRTRMLSIQLGDPGRGGEINRQAVAALYPFLELKRKLQDIPLSPEGLSRLLGEAPVQIRVQKLPGTNDVVTLSVKDQALDRESRPIKYQSSVIPAPAFAAGLEEDQRRNDWLERYRLEFPVGRDDVPALLERVRISRAGKEVGVIVTVVSADRRKWQGFIPNSLAALYKDRLNQMPFGTWVNVKVVGSEVADGKLLLRFKIWDDSAQERAKVVRHVRRDEIIPVSIQRADPAGLYGLYQSVAPVFIPMSTVTAGLTQGLRFEEWTGRILYGKVLSKDEEEDRLTAGFYRLKESTAGPATNPSAAGLEEGRLYRIDPDKTAEIVVQALADRAEPIGTRPEGNGLLTLNYSQVSILAGGRPTPQALSKSANELASDTWLRRFNHALEQMFNSPLLDLTAVSTLRERGIQRVQVPLNPRPDSGEWPLARVKKAIRAADRQGLSLNPGAIRSERAIVSYKRNRIPQVKTPAGQQLAWAYRAVTRGEVPELKGGKDWRVALRSAGQNPERIYQVQRAVVRPTLNGEKRVYLDPVFDPQTGSVVSGTFLQKKTQPDYESIWSDPRVSSAQWVVFTGRFLRSYPAPNRSYPTVFQFNAEEFITSLPARDPSDRSPLIAVYVDPRDPYKRPQKALLLPSQEQIYPFPRQIRVYLDPGYLYRALVKMPKPVFWKETPVRQAKEVVFENVPTFPYGSRYLASFALGKRFQTIHPFDPENRPTLRVTAQPILGKSGFKVTGAYSMETRTRVYPADGGVTSYTKAGKLNPVFHQSLDPFLLTRLTGRLLMAGTPFSSNEIVNILSLYHDVAMSDWHLMLFDRVLEQARWAYSDDAPGLWNAVYPVLEEARSVHDQESLGLELRRQRVEQLLMDLRAALPQPPAPDPYTAGLEEDKPEIRPANEVHPRSFWERPGIGEAYDDLWDNDQTRQIHAELLNRVGDIRDQTVMEVGAGTGIGTELLLKAVGPRGKVIAVEQSSEMLRQARKRLRNFPNVKFRQVDALQLRRISSSPVDGIVSFHGIHLFGSPQRVLKSWKSRLNPGGWLAFDTGFYHGALPEEWSNLNREFDRRMKSAIEQETGRSGQKIRLSRILSPEDYVQAAERADLQEISSWQEERPTLPERRLQLHLLPGIIDANFPDNGLSLERQRALATPIFEDLLRKRNPQENWTQWLYLVARKSAVSAAGLEETGSMLIDRFEHQREFSDAQHQQIEGAKNNPTGAARYAITVPLPHSFTVYVQQDKSNHLLYSVEQSLHVPADMRIAVEPLSDQIKDWDEMGYVLGNAGLQNEPLYNPENLPYQYVWPDRVQEIDPLKLLAEVLTRRLGLPDKAVVGQMLYQDSDGVRLVLFSKEA